MAANGLPRLLQKILNIQAISKRNTSLILRRNTTSFRYLCFARNAANENPIFLRARDFEDRTAVIDKNSKSSYKKLLQLSGVLSREISETCLQKGEEDLRGKRVTFLCPRDLSYVVVQWAIWRNGGIAVPLCSSHPINMMEYFIEDADSTLLVTTQEFYPKVQPLIEKKNLSHMLVSVEGRPELCEEDLQPTAVEIGETEWDDKGAILFYTSGTTGRPKGVLTTHGNMRAQICGMVKAWGWTEKDCILHVLPLHHIHGVINVLSCALWVGATCVMLRDFEPKEVWQYLTSSTPQLSLFMAVPTIYAKLIEHYRGCEHNEEAKNYIKTKCSNIRLMVSGSSALSEPTMKEWYEISGHLLLERYGMTEIGMALSNSLNGPRIAGSVGTPLPGVEVRLVAKDEQEKELDDQVLVQSDERGTRLHQSGLESYKGALQVRGPPVFKSYWRKPSATKESFAEDNWFRTGDDAEFKDGIYKILGRSSVDIIKSGGYKISALEIERELLAHPCIRDCAVVGAPDAVWGERVAAIVSLHANKNLTLQELREWASNRLGRYQLPSALKATDELPRNAMGKRQLKGKSREKILEELESGFQFKMLLKKKFPE